MGRIVVASVVTLVMILMTVPAQGQAQLSKTTTQEVIDVYFTAAEYPCLVESIHVIGTYQSTVTFNFSGNSTWTFSISNKRFKTTAVGVTSGATYQFSGPLNNTVVGVTDYYYPIEWSYRDIIHIVGAGKDGQSLFVHTLFHFNYDPETGVMKNTFDHSTLQCK